MDIQHAFAGVVVGDRDGAAEWYGLLFDRPPDILPNDAEAIWQLAGSASLYILAKPERAGRSSIALVVPDLEAERAALAGRGIDSGDAEHIPGAGWKAVVTDPDGNQISLIQLQ